MASVGTYLNFSNNTEEVFNFYKTVFGGEFTGNGIMRFGDMPPQEGAPELSEEDKNLVMHVGLSILGGHNLMGSDAPASMGFNVNIGNNSYICLTTDTKAEADQLFAALSEGGQVEMPLAEMFWGSYFGSCVDKYGIKWMFDCPIQG
ncbi:MAG: VOC family protein [Saprospiraceae bacterium]|nr:VOC family protein [Saprospiraceae bacterium]